MSDASLPSSAVVTSSNPPIPAELTEAIAKAGLMAEGARSLQEAFAPHFHAFHDLVVRARAVQPNQPKAAREVRLELRAIRIAGEKTKDSLKSDVLLRGRAIDGCNNILKFHVQPLEAALEAIEQAEERAEFARLQQLTNDRAALLRPYADPSFYALGQMPEPAFQQLLAGVKAAALALMEAERQAEVERATRAKAEAEERDRLRAENVRLAMVAAEERRQREEQEAEGRRLARQHEERLQREQLERDRQADAERAERRAEEKRIKAEQDLRDEMERKARIELEEEANLERSKREKAEAVLAKKQAAEAEKERKDAAAARKAASAPDRAKLEALHVAIRNLRNALSLSDERDQYKAQTILDTASSDIFNLTNHLGENP